MLGDISPLNAMNLVRDLDPSIRGNISHENICERLSHKQILSEYDLILQKKSQLSSVQRKEITDYCTANFSRRGASFETRKNW